MDEMTLRKEIHSELKSEVGVELEELKRLALRSNDGYVLTQIRRKVERIYKIIDKVVKEK